MRLVRPLPKLQDRVNQKLDRLVSPTLSLLGRSRSAFSIALYTGLLLGTMLATLLAVRLDLSLGIVAAAIILGIGTFLSVTMLTKVLTGTERIVFYRQGIAALAAISGMLWLVHQPLLPYLDVMMLGIGLCLACCRVGCLMAGCCHGRPCSWGVCYREEHATTGFTPHYVGVRLFPIQLVESAAVLAIVAVGCAVLLSGYPAGTALAWFVVSYALVRIGLEFVRGNPIRHYVLGFSEAQWLSLLLTCAVAWSELAGALPLQDWQVVAPVLLVGMMIAVTLRRRFGRSRTYRILHPQHIAEFAASLEHVTNLAAMRAGLARTSISPGEIPVSSTSIGVKVSATVAEGANGQVYHYALSTRHETMTEEMAVVLAKLLVELVRAGDRAVITRGTQGIIHVALVPAPAAKSNHVPMRRVSDGLC